MRTVTTFIHRRRSIRRSRISTDRYLRRCCICGRIMCWHFWANVAAIGGASPTYAAISIALGLILLGVFAWMARRGYARRNPVVAYCVLFPLLTAVGVAGLRS